MTTAIVKNSYPVAAAPTWDIPRVMKSPLLTALALIALGTSFIPLRFGIAIFACSLATIVRYPHLLPKRLLYEVAIADLIVREKLSNAFLIKQPWWHFITPNLILGGIPLKNYDHTKELQRKGVKAVYAVLEDFEAKTETFFSSPVLRKDWEKAGIRYERLCCEDMTAMSLKSLQVAVRFVRDAIAHGKIVYLHCKAGRGRSAMIAIAYLMREKKMSLQKALELVCTKRYVVNLRPCQLERLQEYERFLAA